MGNNDAEKKGITVAISEMVPLVIEKNKRFSGFEIELWNMIAQKLNLDFQYKKVNFSKIFDYVCDGRADVAIAGITINKEREEMVDFSHNTLESGLLVLVSRDKNMNAFNVIRSMIKNGYKKILETIAGVGIFIFLFGNIVWFAEKNMGTFNNNYFPGIFESFWWAVVTMSTVGYGDFVPQSWAGRAFGMVVIFSGYIIFGFFIAEISSLITMSKLRGNISGHEDLSERNVATVEKTISVDALMKINANIVKVKSIEKAYAQLKDGLVDAVVFDAPTLLYFVRNGGMRNFKIVGDLFNPHAYGIVVNEGSTALKESINRALLELRESGEYDILYRKWFGDNTKLE
ncbi:MAG: extracellular solute-binding protein family 3 [uncultured bacterium]|nr:MAG: extracellular solute-binding protein family 3 [uncultured bacterium]